MVLLISSGNSFGSGKSGSLSAIPEPEPILNVSFISTIPIPKLAHVYKPVSCRNTIFSDITWPNASKKSIELSIWSCLKS